MDAGHRNDQPRQLQDEMHPRVRRQNEDVAEQLGAQAVILGEAAEGVRDWLPEAGGKHRAAAEE